MYGAFHISHRENLRTHPVLGYLAGWVGSRAADSPAVTPEERHVTRNREVLYVMEGMGRVEIDGSCPDVRPGTVLKLDRGTPYRIQPSPDQPIDVRRVA